MLIHPGTPVTVSLPSTHSVKPEVSEQGNTVEIWTDDLRLNPGKLAFVDIDEKVSGASRYGFRLEYQPPGSESWTPLLPINGDQAWNWQYLSIEAQEGAITVEGVASKYQDRLGGATLTQESRAASATDFLVGNPELRILVIPMWNFWDWDDTGYETTIDFRTTDVIPN